MTINKATGILVLSFILGSTFLFANNAQAAPRVIDWQDYPFALKEDVKDRVAYGSVTVSASKSAMEQNYGDVTLAFAVVQATPGSFSENAILAIPGGPGQSATDVAGRFASNPFFQRILKEGKRDIVLLDPRGVGKSTPYLCNELHQLDKTYWFLFGKSKQDAINEHIDAINTCKQRLQNTGLAFSQYSAKSYADDAETIKNLLGYQRWLLWGHSYGSRYGQQLMLSYPDSIEGAFLSGIVPIESFKKEREFQYFYQVLQRIFDECKENSVCDEAYPKLESKLYDTFKRFKNAPVSVPINHSKHSHITIDEFGLMNAIFGLLYVTNSIEVVPLFIESLHSGDDWILNNLATILLDKFAVNRNDNFLAVSCNDASEIDKELTQVSMQTDLASVMRETWLTKRLGFFCDLIGASDVFVQKSFPSNVPVVIADGVYDPVTPPQRSQVLIPQVAQAQHFTLSNRAHDVTAGARTILRVFLSNPQQLVNTDEYKNLGTIVYRTDVVLNKGIANISKWIMNDTIWSKIAILALGGILISVALIASVFTRESSITAVIFSSIFAVVLAISLIGAFYQSWSANPFLTSFGMLSHWAWLPYFGWIMLASSIYALYRMTTQWRDKQTPVKTWSAINCIGTFCIVGFCLYAGVV
uniref:alpha/beta fold hydrolase n=1 Tax=Ningiella ruwaisensis TaxID=2364274 RepID=UPI001445CEAD|nr:alpha/beta fold hydrolase [Ningiella ruwaisensis]